MRRDIESVTAMKTWINSVEHFCTNNVVRNDSFKDKEGCLFSCQLDVENMGFRKDGYTQVFSWKGEFCIQLGVIVTRQHNVFVAVNMFTRGEKICRIENLPWENTSNHDSCWRSDGLDLRKVWGCLDKATHELLCKVTEPKDFSGLNYFLRQINFAVPVEVQTTREENYRHKLDAITRLEKFPVVLYPNIRIL